MRRIRHSRGGDPEAVLLEEVPEPTPGPGELLVWTEAVGVTRPAVRKLWESAEPVVFGGEIAGTVAGLGEGVTGFAIGDRVTGLHFEPSYAYAAVVGRGAGGPGDRRRERGGRGRAGAQRLGRAGCTGCG
jgi:NADPH:quinone reductase